MCYLNNLNIYHRKRRRDWELVDLMTFFLKIFPFLYVWLQSEAYQILTLMQSQIKSAK